MQQAIPYTNWLSTSRNDAVSINRHEPEKIDVKKLVEENALVVFGKKGCCMCHVVKLLLHGQGVNPSVYVVDETNEEEVEKVLSVIVDGGTPPFPAVFVGGKLFGGLEKVMAAHISGELVPKLREAGALWL